MSVSTLSRSSFTHFISASAIGPPRQSQVAARTSNRMRGPFGPLRSAGLCPSPVKPGFPHRWLGVSSGSSQSSDTRPVPATPGSGHEGGVWDVPPTPAGGWSTTRAGRPDRTRRRDATRVETRQTGHWTGTGVGGTETLRPLAEVLRSDESQGPSVLSDETLGPQPGSIVVGPLFRTETGSGEGKKT